MRSDVVIGVGHIPAESDSTRAALGGDLPRLARGIRGVDAWLGGHSHNQVVDKVAGVPVMIAGSHGQIVGVCDLVVDPQKKRVLESHAELVQTFADEVTPDSAMLARIERWNAAVAPIASLPVGKNARTLLRSRGGESLVGNFVTDAIREAAHADVALQNSGGLRADLPEGAVTKGAIYEVMPFDNVIFTLELTGAELKRALEQALRFGRVTQVSGIRYSFDSSRPEFQRVVSLADTNGVALDEGKLYRVACNDFMATGGDNYDVLSGGKNRTNTGILVRDVLEAFVAARSKDGAMLDYRPEGRVRRVRDRGGADGG
jgi:2',3'-cyclic-nucleotide 2'-phosphodiesterase/3'-nucleotidase